MARALQQSRALATRDPEASQFLASLVLAQPEDHLPARYNPSELYVQLLMICGYKHYELDQMHFVRFFSLIREVTIFKERQQTA